MLSYSTIHYNAIPHTAPQTVLILQKTEKDLIKRLAGNMEEANRARGRGRWGAATTRPKLCVCVWRQTMLSFERDPEEGCSLGSGKSVMGTQGHIGMQELQQCLAAHGAARQCRRRWT